MRLAMLPHTQPLCGGLVVVSLKAEYQVYTRRCPDHHGFDGLLRHMNICRPPNHLVAGRRA